MNLTESAFLVTVQSAPLHDVCIFCSTLCPSFLELSLSTTVKSLALPSLLTPTWHTHTLIRPSFSSPGWTSSFSLYFYARCSSFLIIFLALQRTHSSKSLFRLHWRPRSRPSTLDVSYQWWVKRKDHPVGDVLPSPARETVAIFAVRACCWITFSLLSTRTPNSFPAKLLSRQLASGAWSYSLPVAGLGISFELHETPHNPFLEPAKVRLNGSTTIWSIVTPPSFASFANLLRVWSTPSSRSLMRMLLINVIGPSIDPWGTPLVTDIQLNLKLLITAFWDHQLRRFFICRVHSSSVCQWECYRRWCQTSC